MNESVEQNIVGIRVERPWGWYEVIYVDAGYQIKRILVRPGHRLSYQSHARRAERWVIVAGTADVTLDGSHAVSRAGETVAIEAGVRHRVANGGPDSLLFIEIQLGPYLGEDDIVRYEDDYGRTAK